MSTRTVVIIRHAKSDWPPGVPDLDRPLAERGRRDAPAVGRWLVEQGITPDLVVVSPARRTQETWGLIAAQLPQQPTERTEDRIYAAGIDELMDVLRELDPAVEVVAMVGHNPGSEELALDLAGPGSDDQVLRDVAAKYPTSGVAVLTFDGDWPDLGVQSARLVGFSAPRG